MKKTIIKKMLLALSRAPRIAAQKIIEDSPPDERADAIKLARALGLKDKKE